MKYYKKQKNNGFIALITSIILSIIIFLIASVSSNASFWSRLDSGSIVEKDKSFSLALGCLDYAKLKLAENINYAGNENISIESNTCEIKPIESGIGFKLINIQAIVANKTTNLSVKVDAITIKTISVEEKVSF
ncbi:MAG: hypothetical protein WDK96_02050 [Candidatus Paceibacterota bacterium]|jgi:hypothetical protein